MRFTGRRAVQLAFVITATWFLRGVFLPRHGHGHGQHSGSAHQQPPPSSEEQRPLFGPKPPTRTYKDLPEGAWRHSEQWSREMDALIERGCLRTSKDNSALLPVSFCNMFWKFDQLVDLARRSRDRIDYKKKNETTVNVVWATSDYGYWPPKDGLCEDDERGPPIPKTTKQTWRRFPPPEGNAFDPGPWHRCPIKCCHYPHKSEGGPLDLKDADAIRFSWSAANVDRNALEHAFSSSDEFWSLPTHIPWILNALESPVYHPTLAYPDFMNQFEFIAMYNITSDIPAHNFNPYELSERFGQLLGSTREEILADFTPRLQNPLFLQSNCDSRSGREKAADALLSFNFLDSLGSCRNNKPWPKDLKSEKDNRNAGIISRYRYSLTFENSISGDYITEKPYNALAVGTIPIYRGPKADLDTHLRHFFPADSVLFYDAFETPKQLVAYLQTLSSNQTALWNLLKWRSQRKLEGGPRILWEVGKYSVECRMCLAALNHHAGHNHSALEPDLVM